MDSTQLNIFNLFFSLALTITNANQTRCKTKNPLNVVKRQKKTSESYLSSEPTSENIFVSIHPLRSDIGYAKIWDKLLKSTNLIWLSWQSNDEFRLTKCWAISGTQCGCWHRRHFHMQFLNVNNSIWKFIKAVNLLNYIWRSWKKRKSDR